MCNVLWALGLPSPHGSFMTLYGSQGSRCFAHVPTRSNHVWSSLAPKKISTVWPSPSNHPWSSIHPSIPTSWTTNRGVWATAVSALCSASPAACPAARRPTRQGWDTPRHPRSCRRPWRRTSMDVWPGGSTNNAWCMALGTWGWNKNDGKMMEKGWWKWWCLDLCLDLCSYVVLCSVVLDVDVWCWCMMFGCCEARKIGKIDFRHHIIASLAINLWWQVPLPGPEQVGWILWVWPYWWINASPRKVVA